ncbi:hypothetical protein PVK06_011381 [Gossypium arboreum]|uniref:Uncharacterized protein n=1 Tax=Gossypium arboreum TaxID=29729 RepID=A0ABR0Q9L6_GOSAR|nr:hypothetical protein PVK06_011381 [Gossypium arboreum]
MKDSETVKEYFDKLLGIANKVRLLGSEFPDSRLVQKILVTVSEMFEATISFLENTKNLSMISLVELMNALQAQEQRRLMRTKGFVEGGLVVEPQYSRGGKGKKHEKNKKENSVTHRGSPRVELAIARMSHIDRTTMLGFFATLLAGHYIVSHNPIANKKVKIKGDTRCVIAVVKINM